MQRNSIGTSFLVLFVSMTSFINSCFTQCGVGGIVISRQGQVDSFSYNYPNCHRLLGNLEIVNTDITNLDGFYGLDTIDQTFDLRSNYKLTQIEGLKNLKYVETFLISEDTLLTHLHGLRNLLNSSNALSITYMPKIANLNGLERLKNTRQLVVAYCPSLINLSGIDSLETVNTLNVVNNINLDTLLGLSLSNTSGVDHFVISDCPKLRSLIHLPKLETIYDMNISNNPNLVNINGLDSIRRIYYMKISGNSHLEDIRSLSRMNFVDFNIQIINNSILSNIGALANIDMSELDSLVLIENPLLSYCQYPNICDYLSYANNDARIEGNANHCEDRSSVSVLCQLLPFKLLDFNATLDQSKVTLTWITENESKLKSISLEHQDPSSSWNVIDSMSIPYQKLAGKNYYRFIHDAPHQGDNNYQLRFEDLAGNSKYSQVLTVYLKTTGTVEYISKQTKNSFWLESPSKISSFILFDQIGRVVKSGNGHSTLVEVQCADIPSGLYFLRLELENKINISIKLFL
ncbi:MAG: hypothetical protein IPG55_15000 [Saprospiraceae bacterium]|nr:hypothetical protein [Candidatus Defluviibacterium haderslevense]MBK7242326.1 hypothetical protein [Candidatus Defluviibacterium haderslevense]